MPERRGSLWNFMRLNSGKPDMAGKNRFQVSGVRCQQTDDSIYNLIGPDVIRFVILTPDT